MNTHKFLTATALVIGTVVATGPVFAQNNAGTTTSMSKSQMTKDGGSGSDQSVHQQSAYAGSHTKSSSKKMHSNMPSTSNMSASGNNSAMTGATMQTPNGAATGGGTAGGTGSTRGGSGSQ